MFLKTESGLNMFRNDVVMTPLRVKQAIDSRFVKVGDKLNVLINGTWVEFVKVDEPEPDGWYDTLGFTEFIASSTPGFGTDVKTNEVQYTEQEMLDILPFYVKWEGTFTDIETGEDVEMKEDTTDTSPVTMYLHFKGATIFHLAFDYATDDRDAYERIIQSDDLYDSSEEGFYTWSIYAEKSRHTKSDKFIMDGYFEIREGDANGVVLGHYPIHQLMEESEDCYLTSAMVGYYGKADDGIELTAMRRLREVYAEKHAETLKTYYEDSAIMIPEIERLGMQEHYYGRIKDVVDEIVVHVENENWSVAEGLYLDLYYGLKEELM